MARYSVEFTTIDSVLDWYESFNISKWVIYHTKPENVKFIGSDDKDESLAKLNDALLRISKDKAIENSYYLQLLPKAKTEMKPVISFCFHKEQTAINGVPMGYYATKNDVEEIKQMISAQEIDDEIDNLPEEKNILAGLLENPQIQTMLVSAISGLVGSFLVPQNPIKSLSGVDENVDDILNVLYSKGVKVEHLKKLSEMSKEKLQMLIGML